MNNTDNIFAQAFDQAIKRAVEIAVEPLHLQIDGLIGEINQLKTKLAEAALFERTTNLAVTVDDEKLQEIVDKAVTAALEELDIESEVSDALNGMDLNDYIDTDDIASTVADQLDIDDKIREAINGLEVTINLR